jgi:hypothetical protein
MQSIKDRILEATDKRKANKYTPDQQKAIISLMDKGWNMIPGMTKVGAIKMKKGTKIVYVNPDGTVEDE